MMGHVIRTVSFLSTSDADQLYRRMTAQACPIREDATRANALASDGQGDVEEP